MLQIFVCKKCDYKTRDQVEAWNHCENEKHTLEEKQLHIDPTTNAETILPKYK